MKDPKFKIGNIVKLKIKHSPALFTVVGVHGPYPTGYRMMYHIRNIVTDYIVLVVENEIFKLPTLDYMRAIRNE